MSDRSGWYSARILLESVLPEARAGDALFDDRLVLVRASSDSEARSKAHKIGRSQEHGYLNADGERVQWVFREVLDITPIYDADLREGSEIYSQLLDSRGLKAVRGLLSAGRVAALND